MIKGILNRVQYLTGKVRRWHTHHNLHQTNADHQWGVALILLKIHPKPTLALIHAALVHDAGEYLTGDMLGWAKNKDQTLKDGLDSAERQARIALDLRMPVLDSDEKLWLALADALEAQLFIRHCTHLSPAEADAHFPDVEKKVACAAAALGIDAATLELMS